MMRCSIILMLLALMAILAIQATIAEGKSSYYKKKPAKGNKVSLNNYAYYSVWKDFKNTYNKSYATSHEETRRFNIFIENQQKIDAHNREYAEGRKSFEMGMNEFGDLTNQEFNHRMNGFKPHQSGSGSEFIVLPNVDIPNDIDWRQRGCVTRVKNQGQCGSCWAFSAVGSLESQHFLKTGQLVELSEQNLVDCSGPEGTEGCSGGWMMQAFDYVKQNNGIDTEDSYPYEARDGPCRFNPSTVGAQITGYVQLEKGSEPDLEAALATVGPVSVAIDASGENFQFYKQGVYYNPACSQSAVNHAVLAVGYGQTQDGQEFYIVKNSWGLGWGNNGYILMARDMQNHCGIASFATYPTI